MEGEEERWEERGLIQPTKPVFVGIGYGEPAAEGPPVRLRTATRSYKRAIMTPIRLSIWPNSATVKRMGPIWPSPWTRALLCLGDLTCLA